MFKHHENWHPRIFEIPYYLYLVFQCIINRISFKSLAKANYALDHGEIGLGSKYQSQLAFNQKYFLPTVIIKDSLSVLEKENTISRFVDEHDYPVILKSDVGCVGKGICKITRDDDIKQKTRLLLGDYILQKFTPYQYEYGIFFTRYQGQGKISGINKKHFPSVIGKKDQPGFNFGRLDVKAESEEALLDGQFIVIEVNGVASLPTNMFDPSLSLFDAYRIFLHHGKMLIHISKEHQDKSMSLLSYKDIINKVKSNQMLLNKVHHLLKSGE